MSLLARFRFVSVLIAVLAIMSGAARAAPRIELDLLTETGADPTAPQRWYQLLSELGVANLRIRGARGGERVAIETAGSAQSPVYRVTAALTPSDQLIVPGHQFKTSDRAAISAWLERLRTAGPDVASSRERLPFDLAPEMFAAAQQALSRPLAASTAGVETIDVLRELHGLLGGNLRMSNATRQELQNAGPALDELQGLSAGTALAALVKPAGLAFAPQRDAQGELRFVVFKPTRASEIWPVGWPAEERRRELVPKLFEFLNVEISGVSVAKAAEVIRSRLEIPMLFDHAGLAAQGIELENVPAELPAKRTSYSLALQRVLRQAGAKVELRTDEAGRPFVWVYPVKSD